MWEMLDSDFECGTECGGPGPPPEFLIPPPPRPPYLQELSKCSEDPLPDIEMCEAIPILDPSYHTSPSYQTSAIILLCSVLFIIIVLSSLIVWKHKKRVQNFLPCKTPTRGGPINSSVIPGAHLVTYEDPDTHLGHRPLVMHHHHTMEMLHPKSIHFPSGYPMPRTPPLFVCSSPGPDPYRSHDNVYEELGPPRDSDADSEPPLQSDDEFAEDELSLPDERSFHKSPSDVTTVATIYTENIGKVNTEKNIVDNSTISGALDRLSSERNSLLSSSSSNDNRSTVEFRCGSLTGPFRHKKTFLNHNGKLTNYCVGENTSDAVPMITNQRNMMTLPYSHNNINNNKNKNYNTANINYNKNNHNNSNKNKNSDNNTLNNNDNSHKNNFSNTDKSGSLNCFSMTMGNNDVERRNQINNQLNNNTNTVSTIFRERNNVNTDRGYTPLYHQVNNTNINNNNNIARMNNLRSLDRRRVCGINTNNNPSCGYTEPVFHEGILYDACLTHAFNNRQHVYPYIMQEFTTFRALNNTITGISQQQPNQQQDHIQPQDIYSRDSSFGSDSGYSQHTQASMHGEICGSWKTNDNEKSTFKTS